MSDCPQWSQDPESLPLSTTTTTTIPKVSHEPQHWHHHQMTAVISSTPPLHSPHTHHSHRHSQSHHHATMDYTIRPGTRADLNAIHKIYTYYALNSTITLLVHAPDIKYIEKAYEASISRQMPYFVAVTKFKRTPNDTNHSLAQTTHDRGDSQTQESNDATPSETHQPSNPQDSSDKETLLGYVHVTPLHADKAGYGPSVELTMYLHPSYIAFGIGSALFSALEKHLRELPILIFEEGYQDKGEERLAEVIVSRMSDDMERDFEGVRMGGVDDYGVGESGEWPVWKSQGERNKEWYLRKGFEEVGRMKGVGVKFGRRTDVIILQKTLICG